MNSQLTKVDLPTSLGSAWVRRSLEDGHVVSTAVLRRGDLTGGHYFALLPPQTRVDHLSFERGGVLGSAGGVNEYMDSVLRDLAGAVVCTLIVESDVRRHGEPALGRLSLPAAFFGDRVLHWSLVSADTHSGYILDRAAAGYPTNGFLFIGAPSDLSLQDKGDLSPSWEPAIDPCAVIVAAFDAESYVVWLPSADRR